MMDFLNEVGTRGVLYSISNNEQLNVNDIMTCND